MEANGSAWGEMNCTCSDLAAHNYSHAFATFNLIVVILLLPVICLFGVCSNLVNVFLYTRPALRGSQSAYLAALAVSDFFVVATGLVIFWIDSARAYLPLLRNAPYIIVNVLPFGYMAQTCSIYFTVAAALDCYIKVCWPRLAQKHCRVRRAKMLIAAVVVASVLYSSLRFPQLTLHLCSPSADTELMVEICVTQFFMDVNVVYNVYMYMVLMTLLPFVLLGVLNGLIVRRVQRAGAASGAAGDETLTMVAVVVLFLACNTLALIVNMVETFGSPSQLLLNYMSDASNVLVISNSSVNFVVYVVFSVDFAKLFRFYFCGGAPPPLERRCSFLTGSMAAGAAFVGAPGAFDGVAIEKQRKLSLQRRYSKSSDYSGLVPLNRELTGSRSVDNPDVHSVYNCLEDF